MKKLLAAVSVIALAGCVSNVEMANDFGEYAPVNEANSDWLKVSYLAEGASFVQKSRRQDAYKKMHDHCNGKYELKDSEQTGGNNAIVGTGANMTGYYESRHVTFYFRCVDDAANQ
ncbi:hypothetical protein [Microbulbifer elongatus]|uniref:hypothetical protein n=1 Tax=Microbulbifer elongatus TaxID=86173 RepID=UPI001CFCF2C0|nr:hypothetical protein [Microbulbifer elongatus]